MIVCVMIPSNMTGLPFHSCQEFTTPWMSSAVLILVWATWCAQLWVLKFGFCYFSSRSFVSVSEMSLIGTVYWSPQGNMLCPLSCKQGITTECWQICYFKYLCLFFLNWSYRNNYSVVSQIAIDFKQTSLLHYWACYCWQLVILLQNSPPDVKEMDLVAHLVVLTQDSMLLWSNFMESVMHFDA